MSADWSVYEENPKIKFLHASMKSLTNCEHPSCNSLEGACSGFTEAACYSEKLFRKPAMNVQCTGEIQPMRVKEI
jgi:hypothetical protein